MRGEIRIDHVIRGKSGSQLVDAIIAALAERQHGTVARWQLLDYGVSERAIEVRVAADRLHRVYAGVYAVGHRKLSREGRWMAAVLAGGEAAVLCGASAAALHGFADIERGVVHVNVGSGRARPGLADAPRQAPAGRNDEEARHPRHNAGANAARLGNQRR